MAYSEKVIDHYENPRNVGKFDDEDENIGTGMVGAPALWRCHASTDQGK
jgi:nitrogen fixation NifU-like protein